MMMFEMVLFSRRTNGSDRPWNYINNEAELAEALRQVEDGSATIWRAKPLTDDEIERLRSLIEGTA